MSFLGHRTRQVFDCYNIIDMDDQARALERLDAFLEISTSQKRTIDTISS